MSKAKGAQSDKHGWDLKAFIKGKIKRHQRLWVHTCSEVRVSFRSSLRHHRCGSNWLKHQCCINVHHWRRHDQRDHNVLITHNTTQQGAAECARKSSRFKLVMASPAWIEVIRNLNALWTGIPPTVGFGDSSNAPLLVHTVHTIDLYPDWDWASELQHFNLEFGATSMRNHVVRTGFSS